MASILLIPLPPSYIRWVQPDEDELERRCEYDMDEQDLEWLQALNADRKRMNVEPVACELFEIIMDRLEKEWFQLNRRMQKPDNNLITSEDSRCAICEDGDTENSNAIVFCDGCNLAVHQDCYGVPYIPEGQWLCRKCTVSPDRPVTCELCPNSFGAFKQTSENKWAHLVCAIHIPETGVGNPMYMEPIDGIRCIPKQRWKLKCYICKNNVGACIQCSNRSCCVAYHVTCAQEFGLYVKLKPSGPINAASNSHGLGNDPDNHSVDDMGPASIRLSQTFCDKHTPKGHIEALQTAAEARLAQLNSSATPSTQSNPVISIPQSSLDNCAVNLSQQPDSRLLTLPPKKINSLEDLGALKMLATGSQTSKSARAYRKSYSSGPPLVPQVIFQRLMDYSSKLKCAQRKVVINMICKYWSLKREARRGAPLLKRLHLEPWTAANPASHVSEADRRRKYGLLIAVRQDLQQIKNLAAMVCKREKMKLRKVEIQKEIIEKTLFPVYPRISYVLNTLIDADKQKYFLNPVSATDVPDYYEIIKQPMNWATMQRKVDRYEYFRLSEFIADVHLTLTNARIYNHASSTYHKAAVRIGKAIEPLLRDLVNTELPSAIAGRASQSFPTPQQKHHFLEVQSIFPPERIDYLLDVKTRAGLSSRSYDEVLRDRNLRNLQQTKTDDSSEPASMASGPPLRSRPEASGLAFNSPVPSPAGLACQTPGEDFQRESPGASQKTVSTSLEQTFTQCSLGQSDTATASPPNTVDRSSSAVPPLPTTSTPITSTSHASLSGEELVSARNETKTFRKTKKRQESLGAKVDSAIERPSKRQARKVTQGVKPPSQLDEEGLIVQNHPGISKGQLISLKLRALHAKRIETREIGMSDQEKARRHRLREYTRRKRLQLSQANSTPEFLDCTLDHTKKLSPSDSQRDLAPSDESRQDPEDNQVDMRFCRELSCRATAHSTNHVSGRPLKVSSEPVMKAATGCNSKSVDFLGVSRRRISNPDNPGETTFRPLLDADGSSMTDSILGTSSSFHEHASVDMNIKADKHLQVIAPTLSIDSIDLKSGLACLDSSFSSSNQGSGAPSIPDVTIQGAISSLPVVGPPFNMKKNAEELPFGKSANPSRAVDQTQDIASFREPIESFDLKSPGPAMLEPIPAETSFNSPNILVPACPLNQSASNTASSYNDFLSASASSSAEGTNSFVSPVVCCQADEPESRPGGTIGRNELASLDFFLTPNQAQALKVIALGSTSSLDIDAETEAVTSDKRHPLAIIAGLSSNVPEPPKVSSASCKPLSGPSSTKERASIEPSFSTQPVTDARTKTAHLPSPSLATEHPGFSAAGTEIDSIHTDQHGANPEHAVPGLKLVDPSDDLRTDLALSVVGSTSAPDKSVDEMAFACTASFPLGGADPPTDPGPDLTKMPLDPAQKQRKIKVKMKLQANAPTARAITPPSVPSFSHLENSFLEPNPVSVSPKLQSNTVSSASMLVSECETESCITIGSAECQENMTRFGNEKSRPRISKTVVHVGPPEFVNGLPGDKDSFRLFNTGFILPEGTKRHTAASFTNPPDSPAKGPTISRCHRRRSASPDVKHRKPRLSDPGTRPAIRSLKTVRLTLVHNSSIDQVTSADTACPLVDTQDFVPSDLSGDDHRDQRDAVCSRSPVENGFEPAIPMPIPKPFHDIAQISQSPNKSSKALKKLKPTRAQQEKELPVDSRGFVIYPRATRNSSKNPVHPLAREAFRRLSQDTRLPEEGFIPDGTLVWAKVPGHNWFPAEVGMPDHPFVPPSVVAKQSSGKMDNQLLVMFFDSHKSWQWVPRRNTRLLGESDELDALLSSEAYVINKAKLEEIRNSCTIARSNMALPEDEAAEDAQRILEMMQPESGLGQEPESTEAWEEDFQKHGSHQECVASDEMQDRDSDSGDIVTTNLVYQEETRGGEPVPPQIKQTRSRQLRSLNSSVPRLSPH